MIKDRFRRWRRADSARQAANAAAYHQQNHPFPGRWISGISLVCAPVLLLTGILLRIRFHFFYPDQLAAYDSHPTLITTAYACFAFGVVLLWPGVMALAQRIAATHPSWALWGGGLVMFGLFTRTFQFGTDHLSFHLTDSLGTQTMVEAIGDYYQSWRDTPWHPFKTLSAPAFLGWVVLAVAAYRSGALGVGRAVALGLMSMLALGTLKGTEVPQSIIAAAGLCVALVPFGIQTLRAGPRPTNRALGWIAVCVVTTALAAAYGPRG
ncbi:hypothetical protein FXF51_05175 [Nonomuraea sp. PA05]|uniref:hypothetical protein n=1 Tax=Nonomuraea sp. PA05 TaxID=2604466 RepID=UPI0011D7FF7E|nr:hypothetical protein [Nonomuraea sp. PA05]TYB69573.1 hypothetical protein FXF51_05175 [Nonomuraea sp. PA05]